jgi:hypothetical protein
MGSITSREAGRDPSFFQGPGESPVISGDGSGVTSAIALSIGEDKAEFGVELKPDVLPTLLANIFLMLGVRCIGFIGMFAEGAGSLEDSLEFRELLCAVPVAAVTV